MPNITFSGARNYEKNDVSIEDFKGKWLFLDFWTLACKSCVESFSKIDKFQREFPDDIQFLLVGRTGREYDRGVEAIFDRISKSKKLKVTACFDSALFSRWNIETVPQIYIVDPQGKVRFITDGRDVSSAKLKSLLAGSQVTFYPKGIDRKPLDIGLSHDSIIYGSTLGEWNGEQQSSGYYIDRFVNFPEEYLEKGWHVAMAPLYELYNYAYFGRGFWLPQDHLFYGKVSAFPVLELDDPSLFKYDYNFDVGRGTYNYSLTLPPGQINESRIMSEIQSALRTAFGYKVSIVKRKMPVWNLVSKSGMEDKLRTKGGQPFLSAGSPVAGFTLKNHNIAALVNILSSFIQNDLRIPLIDKTGIDFNIDITLSGDMTSYSDVRHALQNYGLDLVNGKKKMKVLVIKNP